MKLKYFLAIILSFSLLNTTFSQNNSSRKTEDDPAMLKKMQGAWMHINAGEDWYKVEIKNENCKIWHSDPQTGNWNDGMSKNDPARLTITGCYKITDRNEYDGKLQSESLAFTVYDDDNKEGYTLNIHIEGGETYLRIMPRFGTKWIYCKKVPSTYSPWN